MIYLITFILSLVFLNYAIKLKYANKKVLYVFFLTIVIPCFIAGCRGLENGYDVKVYVSPIFKYAIENNIKSFFVASFKLGVKDIFYVGLTYIVVNLFKNFSLYLFILELLVILPMYKTLINTYKKKSSVLFGMLIVYLIMYNQTFNMVRQSIAMAFGILGFSYFLANNNKKGWLNIIISIFFHNTAIIFIVIVFLYKIFVSEKVNNRTKQTLSIFLIIICIVVFFEIETIIKSFVQLKLMDGSVLSYITIRKREKIDFSYINTIFYALPILLSMLRKKQDTKNNFNRFITTVNICGLILLQLGAVYTFLDRISYYLLYFPIIFVLPNYSIDFKRKFTMNYLLINCFSLIGLLSYWYFWNVLVNYNDAFPYIFRGWS